MRGEAGAPFSERDAGGDAEPDVTLIGSGIRRAIIAIDGPAGAGKSTVARHLAKFFGLLNLESGAMYRAFALKAIRTGVGLDDGAALAGLSKATSIHLEPAEAGNRVYLDGADVTGELREAAVTEGASRVSVHPPIRAWMVGLQKELAARGGVVMEGRDIGTAVFPDADVKIFLEASPEVRGLRRYEQIGGPELETVQPEAITAELRARDERDRNRVDSPLRAAEDAVIVDSTHLTLDEVVRRAEEIVIERLGG